MKWLAWILGAHALLAAFAACGGTEAAFVEDGDASSDAGLAVLDGGASATRGDGAAAAPDAGTKARDAALAKEAASACVHAGEHRMPGTECCAGEGAGSVKEFSLCCRGPGGDCDLTTPNPDAFCCFPGAKCNRKTGQCEARTCWTGLDNCLMGGLPCCDAELVCDPRDAGPFPLSRRCCRPDGLEPPPGQFDCCNTQLHTNKEGKTVCGPGSGPP